MADAGVAGPPGKRVPDGGSAAVAGTLLRVIRGSRPPEEGPGNVLAASLWCLCCLGAGEGRAGASAPVGCWHFLRLPVL